VALAEGVRKRAGSTLGVGITGSPGHRRQQREAGGAGLPRAGDSRKTRVINAPSPAIGKVWQASRAGDGEGESDEKEGGKMQNARQNARKAQVRLCSGRSKPIQPFFCILIFILVPMLIRRHRLTRYPRAGALSGGRAQLRPPGSAGCGPILHLTRFIGGRPGAGRADPARLGAGRRPRTSASGIRLLPQPRRPGSSGSGSAEPQLLHPGGGSGCPCSVHLHAGGRPTSAPHAGARRLRTPAARAGDPPIRFQKLQEIWRARSPISVQ
jgi:hypothetical protein